QRLNQVEEERDCVAPESDAARICRRCPLCSLRPHRGFGDRSAEAHQKERKREEQRAPEESERGHGSERQQKQVPLRHQEKRAEIRRGGTVQRLKRRETPRAVIDTVSPSG